MCERTQTLWVCAKILQGNAKCSFNFFFIYHETERTATFISILVYWSVFLTGNNNHCHNSALFLFCNYTTDISLCHCRHHHYCVSCTLLHTSPPSSFLWRHKFLQSEKEKKNFLYRVVWREVVMGGVWVEGNMGKRQEIIVIQL